MWLHRISVQRRNKGRAAERDATVQAAADATVTVLEDVEIVDVSQCARGMC